MDASGFTPQEKMSLEEKGKEMGIEIKNSEKLNDRLAKVTIEHGSDKRFKVFPVREMMDIFPDVLKIKLNYDPEKDLTKIGEQIRALRQNEPRMNSRCCHQCARTEEFGTVRLMKCGHCKKARYCSVGCQKEHWGKHKIFCKKYVDLKNEKKKIAIVKATVFGLEIFFWDDKGEVKPVGFMNLPDDLPSDIIADITDIGVEIAKLITNILNKESQIESAPKPEPKTTVIRVIRM